MYVRYTLGDSAEDAADAPLCGPPRDDILGDDPAAGGPGQASWAAFQVRVCVCA